MNIDIRDFDESERKEITAFLLTNLNQSNLNNLVAYDEEPYKRAETFCNIYGVMESASRFLKDQSNKGKMDNLLRESEDIYNALLPLYTQVKNSKVNFGIGRKKNKVIEIVIEPSNHKKIKKLINIFVTLSERNDPIVTADIFAVDMSTPEGKELVKAIDSE